MKFKIIDLINLIIELKMKKLMKLRNFEEILLNNFEIKNKFKLL